MRAFFGSAILLFGLISALTPTLVQKTQNTETHGQFIVAGRDLSDPFFRESVVLMLPITEHSLLVGLIINKPSKILVRDVFPDSPALQKLDAKAYFGGPVDAEVVARSAIFRTKSPPKNATLVFGDVYVSFDPDTIAVLAANPQQASTLRVLVGRAQWGAAQFENEAASGAWHSLPATPDSVFSAYPEDLWHTLIDRADPRPVVQSAPPFSPLATVVAASSPSGGLCRH